MNWLLTGNFCCIRWKSKSSDHIERSLLLIRPLNLIFTFINFRYTDRCIFRPWYICLHTHMHTENYYVGYLLWMVDFLTGNCGHLSLILLTWTMKSCASCTKRLQVKEEMWRTDQRWDQCSALSWCSFQVFSFTCFSLKSSCANTLALNMLR